MRRRILQQGGDLQDNHHDVYDDDDDDEQLHMMCNSFPKVNRLVLHKDHSIREMH